jgi:hypothetical protein
MLIAGVRKETSGLARAADIRKALQRSKGVAISFPSIHRRAAHHESASTDDAGYAAAMRTIQELTGGPASTSGRKPTPAVKPL